MRPDERQLLAALLVDGAYRTNNREPRHVGAGLGMNYKRVAYLCEKWDRRGWYDYGVTVDMGWLTPEGVIAIRAALGE